MSLITRCPACGTMFRVVPDQLRISEGWVRCGHCAEVFDATAHMMGEAAAPANAGPVPTFAVPESDTLPPPEPPGFDSPQVAVAPRLAVAPVTRGDGEIGSAAPSQIDSAFDSGLRESELDQPFVFRRSDLTPGDEAPSSAPAAPDSQPTVRRAAGAGLNEDEEADHDVSFLRDARRSSDWQRPRVRALLGLGVLVLATLLAGQYALHDRDRLAAAEPALRPWLDRLCEVAGCSIGPLRQIEALAIDASAFNKLRTDTYRLSFTLRNNHALPVALPAMELTLTDGQDQPVLRRVLTPAELGAPLPVIGPGSDWSASVALAVNGTEPGGRIAGYRLLAFYP